MRTITTTTTLYTFDELSPETKQHALENLYDLNVDHEWWDFTYEDAKNIGLKLSGFDLDRNRHATGELSTDAETVANKILADHGPDCDTHQTAKDYLVDLARLKAEQCQYDADADAISDMDFDYIRNAFYDIDTEDIDQDFLRSLLEDYAIKLQKEYEYLTSEEAIIETIEANDYEFTEAGDLY